MESPVCLLSPNPMKNGKPQILLNKDCFKTESSFSITDDDLTLEEALYNNQLSYPFFQDMRKSVRFGDILSEISEASPTAKVITDPNDHIQQQFILNTQDNNHLTDLFSANEEFPTYKNAAEITPKTSSNNSAMFFNSADSLQDLKAGLPQAPIGSIIEIDDVSQAITAQPKPVNSNKTKGGIKRMFSFRGKRHAKNQCLEDELNETNETLEFQRKMCKSLKEQVDELEAKNSQIRIEIKSLHLEKKVMNEQINSLAKKCEDSHNAYQMQMQRAKIDAKKVEFFQRQVEIGSTAHDQLQIVNIKLSHNHKQFLFCQLVSIALIEYIMSVFDSIIVPKIFLDSDWSQLRGPYFDVDEMQKRFEKLKLCEIENLKNQVIEGNLESTEEVSVETLLSPLWHFKRCVVKTLSVCK